MSNQLAVIEKKLQSPETGRKLLALMGVSGDNERGQQEVFRYASSVLAEVQKSAGDSRRDLTVCNPDSIVQSMLDAASFGLTIDGRQHAHLIKRGNNAQFQIGYRGYLAKIKEHYPDADFTVELVFDGDEVKVWAEDSTQRFTLVKKDAFTLDQSKFKGVLFAVSYTDSGKPIQKVVIVPKERIDRARKAAAQDYIWSSDYFEKAKGAAIKAACKYQFAAIQGLQEMIRYDNENNYDLNKQAAPQRSSIIDNINQQIVPTIQHEVLDVIEVEVIPPVDTDALYEAGKQAAQGGVESYLAWRNALEPDEIEAVKPMNKELSKLAKESEENDELPI